MNIILIYFAIKYKGDWDLIYKALDQKEKVSLKDVNELEEKMKEEQWDLITLLDVNYPKRLKEAYKPPFVLWCKGDKSLLDKNIVSFTGNQVDEKIKNWIEDFVPELLRNASLITSGFEGVETEVEKLASGKGLIHIASCGIDLVRKDCPADLIISEYPNGEAASPETYRNRNRLISALSQYLILASSEKNGKINNLVSQFLNLGKEIYCLPGDGSEKDGNSELIKQGASLITSLSDISN